jgi:cell division protein FtsB
MNVDLGIWDKLTRMAMFLLFIAGLLLVAVWYYPLIKQNENTRREMLKLDLKIQKEEERGRQLKGSVDALRTDPKTVERLAREQLRYARPGETVIQFEAPATNTTSRF